MINEDFENSRRHIDELEKYFKLETSWDIINKDDDQSNFDILTE